MSQRGRGRPAASSREAIERVAMRLFQEHGYAATTIALIASQSQVSRTSVFRYWGSKSEIVWSEFDAHTARLGDLLIASDPQLQAMQVIRVQILENMRQSMLGSALWRERFAVLESAPELRAEEAEHWAAWAQVVAVFVAKRHGFDASDVVPQSIGGAVQAAFLAVLRRRLASDTSSGELLPALDAALSPLCTLLQEWLDRG